MPVAITGKIARFKLAAASVATDKPAVFGEDFSHWLVTVLERVGVQAAVICMENKAWNSLARYQGATYELMVTGASAGDATRPDYGQWSIGVVRKRSLLDKVLGKNRISANDPLIELIMGVMRKAGFDDIAVEA